MEKRKVSCCNNCIWALREPGRDIICYCDNSDAWGSTVNALDACSSHEAKDYEQRKRIK